jgi:hypothetical protein
MIKKFVCLFLFNFTLVCVYSEENKYIEIMDTHVNKLVGKYNNMNNNIMIWELQYENDAFNRLMDLFSMSFPHAIDLLDNIPILNKMYWSAIRIIAMSTALYNNGYVKEENFISGTKTMRDGLVQILGGVETLGLDYMDMINYIPPEYSE